MAHATTSSVAQAGVAPHPGAVVTMAMVENTVNGVGTAVLPVVSIEKVVSPENSPEPEPELDSDAVDGEAVVTGTAVTGAVDVKL